MSTGPKPGPADDAWAELGDDNAPDRLGSGRWFLSATAAIVAIAAIIWAAGGAAGGDSFARDIILIGLVAVAGGCYTLVRRWWDPLPTLGYLRPAAGAQHRVAELLMLSGAAAVGVGIVVLVVA